MKRFPLECVLALLLVLLCGCGGQTEAQTETTATPEPTDAPGVTVNGVPLEQFDIVTDDTLLWDLADETSSVAERVSALTGTDVRCLSDEEETGGYEIVLCSPGIRRTPPVERDGAWWYVDENAIYLCGDTEAELGAAVDDFLDKHLVEDEALAAGEDSGEILVYTETVYDVTSDEELTSALAEAEAVLTSADRENPQSVTISLGGGIYTVTQPITLPETDYTRFTLSAAEGASPMLSGMTELPLETAEDSEEGYLVFQLTQNEDGSYPVTRDFYLNGSHCPYAVSETFSFPGGIANWEDPDDPENLKGLYVPVSAVQGFEGDMRAELTVYDTWEFHRFHILSVDWEDTYRSGGKDLVRVRIQEDELVSYLETKHEWLEPRGQDAYVANHVSLLTPGTCSYDALTGKLYVMPEEGETVESVGYAAQDRLVQLENVKNVTVSGITFRAVTCTSAVQEGFLSHQTAMDKRTGIPYSGAVCMKNCENVTVTGCTFEALGGYGVLSLGTLDGCAVTDCTFRDVGMSAVSLGERSSDWTAETAQYRLKIENCSMTGIGQEYPSAPAVVVTVVDGLQILHNSVSDVPYTGMSIGWGWTAVEYAYGEKINVRGAEIAYNRIENYMAALEDGGGIYILGANCTQDCTELFNSLHDNFVSREKVDKTRFHPGYYLDGSASNWHIYDNVAVNVPDPVYIQYRVTEQLTHNDLCERLYATLKPAFSNAAEPRNVLVEDTFVESSAEALYAAYPAASEIYGNSGCGY